MKKSFILVLLVSLSFMLFNLRVGAYSGPTFEQRAILSLGNKAVSYGSDPLYSNMKERWHGIQHTYEDHFLYKVPVSMSMFETEYMNSAYDIYTKGSLDTKGELYNVTPKWYIPFPDFWNARYRDTLGSKVATDYNSGESYNFSMTARLDLTKDYAVKVSNESTTKFGNYLLYTEPHQDQTQFMNRLTTWIPYSDYHPDKSNQYYIDVIYYHTPQTATFATEYLRLAAEDPGLFKVLLQAGTQALAAAVGGALACSGSGPGAVACGVAIGVAASIGFAVHGFIKQERAEQEYLSAVNTCDAIFNTRYINGKYTLVPRCMSGIKQVITSTSFIFVSQSMSTFNRFSATSGETITGPKYLAGYWA